MATAWTLDRVRSLDAADRLAGVQDRFVLPKDVVYLDGNSLGALARGVPERANRSLEEEWGRVLVDGWVRRGWLEAPERVGDRIAPIIGALPGEVLVADTTSVALAKLVGAALCARPGRPIVLSSSDNFPSDLYAARGAARLHGGELRVVDRHELLTALGADVALCCLTQVDFRTGELFDVAALTDAVHRAGALMLWDLCHSAGAVPVGCEEHGVDLAVGCTYKYLNGGPGSPSFLYVRRELQDQLENPLPGWLGHDAPFAFEPAWRPAAGIRRFLTSTPPVVALAVLDAALDAFDGVSIGDIRDKSTGLTQLFIDVVQEAELEPLEVVSPSTPGSRGSQVSLRHPDARGLVERAAGIGVVGDFRPPDLCRFGFAPLYLSYADVHRAAEIVVELARSMDG